MRITAESVYEEPITVRKVLVMACADVDIFLLCEEDQTTTKDAVYTADQVREQLKKTMSKMYNALGTFGVNVDAPLRIRKHGKIWRTLQNAQG